MNKTKTQKGITLVTLIITIILLLILAVVSISAVTGDGIIAKAKQAKTSYEQAQADENTTLKNYLDQIEENLPGGNGEKIATKGKIVTGSNAIYTETVEGKTQIAKIPVGFCVVKDIKGDENSITRGLVISDVAEDDLNNSKGGNQFVWIPVEEYSNFHLIEGYYKGSIQSYLSVSREAGDTSVAGSLLSNNNVAGTEESIAMYKSVKDNKGFYIARFEAGINGTQDNYSLSTATATDGSVKPLSQKGVGVWNNIAWGGTSSDTASDGLPGDDTADGAVKVARSMYTKSSTCGVTSTLCYGVQWDAVMNYIDPNYLTGTSAGSSFVSAMYSSEMGNYTKSLALTGSSSAYEQKHIYDLAGNVWERTMESYDSSCRVCRGGWYGSVGSYYPASSRSVGINPESKLKEYGFRPALYL